MSRLPDPTLCVLRRCATTLPRVRRLPNDYLYTLPLRTTGPAAAKTSASDARTQKYASDACLPHRPGRSFCWLCFLSSKGQPSLPDVAFIRPPKVEGGERATVSLAYKWEYGIVAVSEVLAEPVPCEMPVRSTQIRGAVARAECACGELPCPGCIRMGRVELVMHLSPLLGSREPSRPL